MLKKHCEFVENQPSYAATVASSSKIEEVKEDCSYLALLGCIKIDHAAAYEKCKEKHQDAKGKGKAKDKPNDEITLSLAL